MSALDLPANAVHLWYHVTSELGRTEFEAHLSDLSTDEIARCHRFVHTVDQRDYAAAHAGLRRALSRYTPKRPITWQFERSAQGKPFVSPAMSAPYAINLSHTRGLVAWAIAPQGDVGIDVESCPSSPDLMELARQNFSTKEVRQLAACAPDAMRILFIELWTLKEAFVKATGDGITVDLSRWGFRLDRPELLFDPPPGIAAHEWTFALYAPTADTRMAIAARRADASPWQLHARAWDSDRDLAPLRASPHVTREASGGF